MRRRTYPTITNRQQYLLDGVTVFRGVLDLGWIAELNRAVDIVLMHPSPFARFHRDMDDPGGFSIDILMHKRLSVFHDLAFDSPATRVAASILDAREVVFFYDQLFVKRPLTKTRTQWHQDLPFWPLAGVDIPSLWISLDHIDQSTSATQWHQDLPFWPLAGVDIPSLWISLDHIDQSTSAVRYAVGSHIGSRPYCAVDYENREQALADGCDVCPDLDKEVNRELYELRSYELEPGDIVVHHPMLIHGANGNSSKSKRRAAVSLRYCGTDVRWFPHADAMVFPGTEDLVAGTSMKKQSYFKSITLTG